VKALVRRVTELDLLTSPTVLFEAADALTDSLTTDTGLDSLGELVTFARSLGGLTADRVTTVTMPVLPAPSDPKYFRPGVDSRARRSTQG
jgi:hypothetical protein